MKVGRVVFRVDASIEIGTGHVMRCLTLAQELRQRGREVAFICRDLPGNMIEQIEGRGILVKWLPAPEGAPPTGPPAHAAWAGVSWEKDAGETHAELQKIRTDWLVVDHYAFDDRWEKAVRRPGMQILAIDDLADRRHDCEILLDHNFGRTVIDYAELTPKHCRMLLGSGYALLRPQFANRRAASLARRDGNHIAHVLIQMGGLDKNNHTSEALSGLQQSSLKSDCRISVVLAKEAPAINVVRQQAARMRWPTKVLVGVENMAKLMEESDLAIGSGGGATYERLYMALPSIVRATAANQVGHLRKMAAAGLFSLYCDADDLAQKINTMLRDGMPAPPDVVGDGAAELADQLFKSRVTLRPPRALDVRRTFHWLQDESLRALFLMQRKPQPKSHFRYWKNILNDPYQHVFSIFEGNMHVGNAGLKNVCKKKSEAEIWLYLGDRSVRGKGVGKKALKELERIAQYDLNLSRTVLHVSKANNAAIGLYQHAGYVEVESGSNITATFSDPNTIKMEKRL